MGGEKKEFKNLKELAAAVKTDIEAFGELYRLYRPKIHRYVLSRVKNKSDAEDITAAIFEKALKNIDKYEPERAKFFTWLYPIASNTVTDYLRKKKSKVGIEDADEAAQINGDTAVEEAHNCMIVMDLLRQLPVAHQEVLVLRFLEEFAMDDIAEILGCRKKYLSARIYRALNALGKLIEKKNLLPELSRSVFRKEFEETRKTFKKAVKT